MKHVSRLKQIWDLPKCLRYTSYKPKIIREFDMGSDRERIVSYISIAAILDCHNRHWETFLFLLSLLDVALTLKIHSIFSRTRSWTLWLISTRCVTRRGRPRSFIKVAPWSSDNIHRVSSYIILSFSCWNKLCLSCSRRWRLLVRRSTFGGNLTVPMSK